MERLIIAALSDWSVEAEIVEGLTGVWTPDRRKVASIGVHVNRGVTTHGFAINVNNDLQPFEWIVPCGIEGCRVTSLGRELGGEQDSAQFGEEVAERFAAVYERSLLPIEAAQLARHVEGIESLIGAPVAAVEAALR
jgi:lipoyl(octanoyl) transferase